MKELKLATKTMSSTQLMNILVNKDGSHKYEKKEINKKIRIMFEDEIARENIYPHLDNQGRVTDYNLPETESIMFVAKWDIDFLRQISEYWVDRNKPEQTKRLDLDDLVNVEYNKLAIGKAKEIANDLFNKVLKQEPEVKVEIEKEVVSISNWTTTEQKYTAIEISKLFTPEEKDYKSAAKKYYFALRKAGLVTGLKESMKLTELGIASGGEVFIDNIKFPESTWSAILFVVKLEVA